MASHKLTDCPTAHVGHGIDDSPDGDVGAFLDGALNPIAGQRSGNEVVWANVIRDISKKFDVVFEVSRRGATSLPQRREQRDGLPLLLACEVLKALPPRH